MFALPLIAMYFIKKLRRKRNYGKKTGLILGCILFIVLAVGSVQSQNKDNVQVNSRSNQGTEISESSGSVSEQQQQGTKKEYEFSNVEMESDQFATYITGVLQNNGGQKGYVQIMIPCYDKDGVKLGDAFANINGIEANGKWKFKAMFTGNETPKICALNNARVSGF